MRHSLLPALLFGFLLAPVAHAEWTLDPARSQLTFVSIKANNVSEINTFGKIEGHVNDAGQVTLRLALDSVETLIPVRNERMRQFLFETTNYQEAVLRAQVDAQQLAQLAVGSIASVNAEGTLLLHGLTQPLTLTMQVARVNAQTLMVANLKPLIVDASKFGMNEGIEKLRELAGLSAISSAVPVNFVITLVANALASE
ncbi:polyisoprenoid-binding protein [Chromatium weissei]|nr:polyisoprenoid-binding protein [Chromatium weissei]